MVYLLLNKEAIMDWNKVVRFLRDTSPEVLASYIWQLKKKTGCDIRLEGDTIIFSIANGYNPDSIVAELKKIARF